MNKIEELNKSIENKDNKLKENETLNKHLEDK
jgi:hypothetical protein